jgi:hypothetical protein
MLRTSGTGESFFETSRRHKARPGMLVQRLALAVIQNGFYEHVPKDLEIWRLSASFMPPDGVGIHEKRFSSRVPPVIDHKIN